MHSLRQALQDHELIILRVIGEWWDIDLTGMNKERCVQTLTDSLPLLDVPQELIYLPPLEAEAIRAIVSNNGRMQAAGFQRQFGQIRQMGPGALERDEPWYEPQSAAEDLWYRGLIYKAMDKTDDGMVEFFYLPDQFLSQFEANDFKEDGPDAPPTAAIPAEIEAPKRPPPPPVVSGKPAFGKAIDLASLGVAIKPAAKTAATAPPSAPTPAPTAAPPTPPPPAISPPPTISAPAPPPIAAPSSPPNDFAPAATNAVDDMTTLLSLAQGGQLRVGQAHRLPPYMQNPHLGRLELLTTLAVELNFLREVDNGLYRPTRAAVGWLQTSRENQLRALIDAWMTSAWNELRHMPTLQCEGSGWQNDPTSARAAVIDLLLPRADWAGLSTIAAQIKQHNPDFQRPNGNYDAWYIRDTLSGTYVRGFENWEQVEGRLIHYILLIPMHWLGLTDIAEEQYRLTPRGIAWLEQDPAPADQQQQAPPVIINADASLTISQHTDRYKRFQASRIAQMMPLVTQQTAGNIVYSYRLTPASLTTARENKITPDRVIKFLQEASDQDLPNSTKRAITRWSEKGGEGRLERVVILRVASAEILDTLRQQAKTRPYLGESLGDLSAVVLESDWQELCTAAAQLGLLLEPPTD